MGIQPLDKPSLPLPPCNLLILFFNYAIWTSMLLQVLSSARVYYIIECICILLSLPPAKIYERVLPLLNSFSACSPVCITMVTIFIKLVSQMTELLIQSVLTRETIMMIIKFMSLLQIAEVITPHII